LDFEFRIETERNIVAQITIPDIANNVVGIIRLSRKHCGNELLQEGFKIYDSNFLTIIIWEKYLKSFEK